MFENAIGCCCGWVDTGVLCVDCRISPGLCTKHEAVEGASTEAQQLFREAQTTNRLRLRRKTSC